MNKDSYQEYISSGRWKCEASPFGGHYWFNIDSSEIWQCEYCKGYRYLANSADDYLLHPSKYETVFSHQEVMDALELIKQKPVRILKEQASPLHPWTKLPTKRGKKHWRKR